MYFIDWMLSGINNRWTTDLLTTIILPAGTTEIDLAMAVKSYQGCQKLWCGSKIKYYNVLSAKKNQSMSMETSSEKA